MLPRTFKHIWGVKCILLDARRVRRIFSSMLSQMLSSSSSERETFMNAYSNLAYTISTQQTRMFAGYSVRTRTGSKCEYSREFCYTNIYMSNLYNFVSNKLEMGKLKNIPKYAVHCDEHCERTTYTLHHTTWLFNKNDHSTTSSTLWPGNERRQCHNKSHQRRAVRSTTVEHRAACTRTTRSNYRTHTCVMISDANMLFAQLVSPWIMHPLFTKYLCHNNTYV